MTDDRKPRLNKHGRHKRSCVCKDCAPIWRDPCQSWKDRALAAEANKGAYLDARQIALNRANIAEARAAAAEARVAEVERERDELVTRGTGYEYDLLMRRVAELEAEVSRWKRKAKGWKYLRRRSQEAADMWFNKAQRFLGERDALRAGVRALADKWMERARSNAQRASHMSGDRRQHYADLAEDYESFATSVRALLGEQPNI